jgi:hypothetical protein
MNLHSVVSHKTAVFISAGVRNSNLTTNVCSRSIGLMSSAQNLLLKFAVLGMSQEVFWQKGFNVLDKYELVWK